MAGFSDPQFDIWNLAVDSTVRSGCVGIFNIVGQLKHPFWIRRFYYELNGGAKTPVYFIRRRRKHGRLRQAGTFNIDTIPGSLLLNSNRIRFTITRIGGTTYSVEIPFFCNQFPDGDPFFDLKLDHVENAHEVGQIVDGNWTISGDGQERRCLELTSEASGYDRIILFGHESWTSGYEIFTRMRVTEILGGHNVGVVFKWNAHERGDGTFLPIKWQTGLGYYCSYCPGLRIRFGVGVDFDLLGRKTGDFVLASSDINAAPTQKTWRDRWPFVDHSRSDLELNTDYCFRMKVHKDEYTLTMWPAGSTEPPPQLTVPKPLDRLPTGAVGVIAYQIAIRVFEFSVRPL